MVRPFRVAHSLCFSLLNIVVEAVVVVMLIPALTAGDFPQELRIQPRTMVIKLNQRGLHVGLTISIKHVVASAWCINPECDELVTNYHVTKTIGPHLNIKGVKVAEVASATSENDQDARMMPTVVGPLKFAYLRDISLIRMTRPLARKGVKQVPLYLGKLRVGQKVTAIGFPGGTLRAIQGTFAQEYADGLLEFDMRDELRPGISGGPVIDETGKAVGLAIGFSANRRLLYAVPVWSLADFIGASRPGLRAQLFSGEIYRPKASDAGIERGDDDARDVFVLDIAQPLDEGVSPAAVLPESYLLLNEDTDRGPKEGRDPSLEVVALRRSAQLMSQEMNNFVARQTLLFSNRHSWQHEVQLIDGRQRFRSLTGKDLFELPVTRSPVPGDEWSGLVNTIGVNLSMTIHFARDTIVGNQLIKVFYYKARTEDQICKLRVSNTPRGLWKGSVPCTGTIWTDEQFQIVLISRNMTPPPADTGLACFRDVILYGWWGTRLVPVSMFLRSTRVDGKVLVTRATFDNYRVFAARTKISFEGQSVETRPNTGNDNDPRPTR